MSQDDQPIDIDPDAKSVTVLVLKPTGQRYTAQTHGVSCQHPVAEGQPFVFPVEAPVPHVGCWGEVSEADVLAMREWLSAHLPFVELDEGRLRNEFGEAWLPVKMDGLDAILVTENCD